MKISNYGVNGIDDGPVVKHVLLVKILAGVRAVNLFGRIIDYPRTSTPGSTGIVLAKNIVADRQEKDNRNELK